VIRFGKEQSVMTGSMADAGPSPAGAQSSGGATDIQVEAVQPQLMPQ
jgi:hypothetical protein